MPRWLVPTSAASGCRLPRNRQMPTRRGLSSSAVGRLLPPMEIARSPRRPSLEWGMFFLALLMIPLILIQVSSEDQDVLFATEVANAVIWVIFVAELIYAWRRSTTAWPAFARTHALDLLIVALSPPFIVPAALGSLRVLRLLRLVRLLAFVGRIQQGTGRMTGGQGILSGRSLVWS